MTSLQVAWAATLPESGRYTGAFLTTPTPDLLARFSVLRERGAGYLEVEIDGQEYPWLTFAFEGAHAVVHAFFAEDRCALLGGDGIIAADDETELSWGDNEGPTTFTGEYVSSVDRAEVVLRGFVSGTPVEALGDWYDL